MTDFEAFANELNVKIETDKNGLYTGMCGVLASICTEVILSDDETIFNLSWDEQKGSLELVMIATVSMTKDMMEISGMNKRIER